MIDFYLMNKDEAEFNQLMVDATLYTEEGTPVIGVLVDKIGPITIGDIVYPEFYTNLRILTELSAEQLTLLNTFAITPTVQYRTWA